jgi:membrane protease YdiL (CAAX protease family)
MAAPGIPRGVLSSRREWLLLAATGVLVVFHYVARADVVGVLGHGGRWSALTRSPLAPNTHFAVAALLLGVLPVLVAMMFGLSPRALGLGIGDWRAGLKWVGFGVPVAILAGWVGAGTPGVQLVYPLDGELTRAPGVFVPHALFQFLYFAAWEVLFRGVLLFGLRDRFGDQPANLLQTALSVLAHFGRPFNETLSAIPAGLIFGWIDLRLRSVWYITVVHWIVGVSLDWFILTR